MSLIRRIEGLSEAVRCSNNCVGVKSIKEAAGVDVARDGLSCERVVNTGSNVPDDVGRCRVKKEAGKGFGDEVRCELIRGEGDG